MRNSVFVRLAVAVLAVLWVDVAVSQEGCRVELPSGKRIYIPTDLKGNDFCDRESQWSYHRMATTENVVVFWEKGFGDDLSAAPDLDGHKMTVDLPNLLARLEYFYQTYRDAMAFTLPGSKSDSLRMMVMLNYSLEGTAYGGDYDETIGALWIAPNRVQDKRLNCIAHEIGHSFQIQIACDGMGHGMGGGIYEMCSQWMLWQVNPEWTTDENYHWQAFRKLFHKRFLDGANIYHSPFVLEWWSTLHGLKVMGNLFREGRENEDIAMAYMRMYGLSLDAMADEMFEGYSRLLTFDFPRVKESHRQHACQLETPTREADGWTMPDTAFVAGTYGFNVVPLPLRAGKIEFEGLGTPVKDGYRWGVVLVDGNMDATYLPMQRTAKGKVRYAPLADTQRAYLVVMGCPEDEYVPDLFRPRRRGQRSPVVVRRYPWRMKVKG